MKVRLRLTGGSDYEIPSSNDAPSPPRCVTGVRMAPLETVSTDAHPLVENTYRRENKLPSYKCRETSRPWSFSCSVSLLCFVCDATLRCTIILNDRRNVSFPDTVHFYHVISFLISFPN